VRSFAGIWVVAEALGRSGVKSFLQLEVNPDTLGILSFDKKRLTALLNYLYGPKKATGERDPSGKVVSDTRDLSRLSRVLSSDKAASVLHAGKSLEQAEIYVDSREESLKRLSKVLKDMGALLKKLTVGSKNSETERLVQSYKRFDAVAKAFVSKEKS
jgi:hypothetical protein